MFYYNSLYVHNIALLCNTQGFSHLLSVFALSQHITNYNEPMHKSTMIEDAQPISQFVERASEFSNSALYGTLN